MLELIEAKQQHFYYFFIYWNKGINHEQSLRQFPCP